MKKEKILKTQSKGQVAFVQSTLTSKIYFLHREKSFKTFDSFLSNLKQKQSGTSSKILHPKWKKKKFWKHKLNEKCCLFKVVWPQKIILYIVKQVSKLLTHFYATSSKNKVALHPKFYIQNEKKKNSENTN